MTDILYITQLAKIGASGPPAALYDRERSYTGPKSLRLRISRRLPYPRRRSSHLLAALLL